MQHLQDVPAACATQLSTTFKLLVYVYDREYQRFANSHIACSHLNLLA